LTIIGISALILLGIILILVEIFFVPGVGFVGILGFALILLGICFAYDLKTSYGHISLVTGALVSFGLAVLAFRENTWIKLGVKSNIVGKTRSEAELAGLEKGSEGVALGRIAPMGKAKFGKTILEVKAYNNVIENGEKLEILKIEGNTIVVNKLKENDSNT
jgi:membrane-bound ClpP family serine protease